MKHPFSSIVLCTLAALTAAEASAATKYHRLTWDGDAAHSAVIGFSPDGTSTNPYVKYGFTTDEASWSTQQLTSTETFGGSLTSHFVRLTNLNANAPVSVIRVAVAIASGSRRHLTIILPMSSLQAAIPVPAGLRVSRVTI